MSVFNRGFEVNVSAVIVTRGDQDLTPVLKSLPDEWETLVWNNGIQALTRGVRGKGGNSYTVQDLSVYGRYAAIEYASHDLIYVQDDDCVVSDPQAIVDEWKRIDEFRHIQGKKLAWVEYGDYVVCNMPPEFRHDFYSEHALVGFGACFHRDAPTRAFEQFLHPWEGTLDEGLFHRTCDIVFTGLTPRVLVDVPKEDMPWAHYEDRLWKQPGHLAERVRMLDLVRQVA